MRGDEEVQIGMSSYVTMEQRIVSVSDDAIRSIRALVDDPLKRMDGELSKPYSRAGGPSIVPERLLRTQFAGGTVLDSVRTSLDEAGELSPIVSFGLEIDELVWDMTVFTRNRNRKYPIAGGASQQLLLVVPEQAAVDRGTFYRG